MVTALVLALVAAAPPHHVGRVVAVQGEVNLTRDSTKSPLNRGTYLLAGDVVETGLNGKLRTLMRDKSVLALPANSRIKITAYDVEPATKKRRARLTVFAGRLWALVTKAVHPDASYEVSTSNAVAGVRGTELVFDVDAAGDSQVTVITGEVQLASSEGQETLGARERGSVQSAGEIALKSASEEVVAGIRDGVRPEQELDTDKADKRLAAALKKKADEGPAAPELAEKQQLERDDAGTGDAVFEDVPADESDSAGDFGAGVGPGDGWFDPSTMGRIRIRIEVRS